MCVFSSQLPQCLEVTLHCCGSGSHLHCICLLAPGLGGRERVRSDGHVHPKDSSRTSFSFFYIVMGIRGRDEGKNISRFV